MRFPAGTIRCERNPSLPVSPINSLPVFEKPRNEIPDLKNIDGGDPLHRGVEGGCPYCDRQIKFHQLGLACTTSFWFTIAPRATTIFRWPLKGFRECATSILLSINTSRSCHLKLIASWSDRSLRC